MPRIRNTAYRKFPQIHKVFRDIFVYLVVKIGNGKRARGGKLAQFAAAAVWSVHQLFVLRGDDRSAIFSALRGDRSAIQLVT